MALTKVTYTDKVENSGATNDGKVLAIDMNELKSVVNGTIDSLEATTVKIGSNAGATSQGTNSVSVGNFAGNTSQGQESVCIGILKQVKDNTSGYTVAIGGWAGRINQGFRVCPQSEDFAGQTNQPANSTCLGNNSQVTATNQVQLGNSSTTTYAYGAVQDRSDERDKADIQDIHLGLDFINALTPKSYKFDYREDYRDHQEDEEGNVIADTRELGEITHDGTHKRSRLHCGLVAQEVKQAMDYLGVDFGGYQDHSINGGQDVLSIGYGELIAPMIKAIQELKAEIEILKGV